MLQFWRSREEIFCDDGERWSGLQCRVCALRHQNQQRRCKLVGRSLLCAPYVPPPIASQGDGVRWDSCLSTIPWMRPARVSGTPSVLVTFILCEITDSTQPAPEIKNGLPISMGSTCLVNLPGLFAIVLCYIYIVACFGTYILVHFGHANRYPMVLLFFPFHCIVCYCSTVNKSCSQ